MSAGRPSRSQSELRVRMVDFDDFGTSGRDNTSRYFSDIGALNAVFRKRLNQALSIHPCIPLADTLHEYVKYQRALEDKYGIILPEQSSPTASSISAASTASPTLPVVKPIPASSVSSVDSSGSASLAKSGETRTTAPVSKSTEEAETVRPSKRKAADEDDNKGKKAAESGIPNFSRSQPPASSALNPPRVDDFQSKLKKPSALAKPADVAKKPVFAGFNFNKEGSSFGQPGASSSTSSFASIFSQAVDGKQDENREPASDKEKSTFKGFAQSAASEKKEADVPVEKSTNSFFGFSKPLVTESTKSGNTKPAEASGFNSIFGAGVTGSFPSSGFPGFSFGNMKMPATNIPSDSGGADDAAENGEDGDEADVPPIVPAEEQDVAETDAAISRRCKVFYLDSGNYSSRGVGMAHLKVISDKALQLLVRAGTSLGNILLNARITKETKVTRTSRDKTESVDVLCLPEPPFKGADPKKFYPYKIKFKDAATADEFYNKLQDLLK